MRRFTSGLLLAGAATVGCADIWGFRPAELAEGGGGGGTTSETTTGMGGTTGSTTTTGLPSMCPGITESVGTPNRLVTSLGANFEWGQAIAWDTSSNVIVGAAYYGPGADFGGGPLPWVDPENEDTAAAIVKYAADGTHLWDRVFYDDPMNLSQSRVFVTSVATDGANNVYATGDLLGVVDFGTEVVSASDLMTYDPDIFVVKLDEAGNTMWVRSFGTPNWPQRALRVATDAGGDLLIAGWSYAPIDLGLGPIGPEFTDFTFVAKLDGEDGHTIWNNFVEGWESCGIGEFDDSFSVGLASDGANALLTGAFDATAHFDTDEVVPAGESDLFVMKLGGENGNVLWYKTFSGGGSGIDDGVQWGTSVAAACDEVLVTGAFTRQLAFGPDDVREVSQGNPEGADGFFLRLTPDGEIIEARTFPGEGKFEPLRVVADIDGNPILAGRMQDGPDAGGVDMGSGIVLKAKSPSAPDNWDGFYARLGPNQTTLWATRIGDGDAQVVFDIATNSSGLLAATGTFGGALALGSGIATKTAKDRDALVVFLNR